MLEKLVSIETVNPPGLNYDVMAELLKEVLEELGLTVKLIEIPEHYLNQHYPYRPRHRGLKRIIVYTRIGYGKLILQFNGHYDVVPSGPGWSMDPFKLVVKDGKAYGRGTSDMKGGIVAVLATLRSLVDDEIIGKLNGSIEAVFVPDEESAGIGTKYFIERVMKDKPEYVIIPEPTSPRNIVIGHKGLARGIIRVYGKQSHASTPWLGSNAFLKAAKLALKINREFKRSLASKKSKYPMEYKRAAYNTLTLGGYALSPVSKESVVPGVFEFSFDIRSIPEENIHHVVNEFKNIVKSNLHDVDISLLTLLNGVVLENSKLVPILKKGVEETLGVEPKEVVSSGRLDVTYYILKGVEALAYGPGDPRQPHRVDEFIRIRDIMSIVRIYRCLIDNLLL